MFACTCLSVRVCACECVSEAYLFCRGAEMAGRPGGRGATVALKDLPSLVSMSEKCGGVVDHVTERGPHLIFLQSLTDIDHKRVNRFSFTSTGTFTNSGSRSSE